MDRLFIKKCIEDALDEVYSLNPGKRCLSPKHDVFVRLALKKIFQDVEKPQPKREKEMGDVFYECDVCQKKCSSTAGLTLHKKGHAGKK